MCINGQFSKRSHKINNDVLLLYVCNHYLYIHLSYLFTQVAKDLGPGQIIVTALCDTGEVAMFLFSFS